MTERKIISGLYCKHQDSELMYWQYVPCKIKYIEVVFKCNICNRKFARNIFSESSMEHFIKRNQDKYKQIL